MPNRHQPLQPSPTQKQDPERDYEKEIASMRLFNRSPHPYHRRKIEVSPVHYDSKNGDAKCESRTDASASEYDQIDRKEPLSGNDDGYRRSAAPSDSGTEADDESYGFLKALPAPPIRPHKGLRDGRAHGYNDISTPLLTPTQIDEDGQRLTSEWFKSPHGDVDGPSPTDDEVRQARQKYVKRRRAELLRRVTEVVLVAAIGLVVLSGDTMDAVTTSWYRGRKSTLASIWPPSAYSSSIELYIHTLIWVSLIGVYPLRLIYWSWSHSKVPFRELRYCIKIPAAFDPATLLYPVFLPVFVSLSLVGISQNTLLPNILLGLASLPTRLIPCASHGHGVCSIHWLISIIPLVAAQHTGFLSRLLPSQLGALRVPYSNGLHPEILVALFPLHQTLLVPLRFITTTSLLPAELQLLSVSLINCLLLAESPQVTILSAALWTGGLCLFIFCAPVLRWGVALARVPRWRLRRAANVIRAHQTFLDVLSRGRGTNKDQSGHSHIAGSSESETNEDGTTVDDLQKSLLPRLNLRLPRDLLAKEDHSMSAIEPSSVAAFSTINDTVENQRKLRKRSNTLPNISTVDLVIPRAQKARKRHTLPEWLLSLTPAEAHTRKWVYACYFYTAIFAIILIPMRSIISRFALDGLDPFGWGIGYMFGDLLAENSYIKEWPLNHWIVFANTPYLADSIGGRGEAVRWWIGAANTRLAICSYWITIIACGLMIVLRLGTVVEVDTRRKVFHGMMVAMLLPTVFVDPAFVALALTLVLGLFLLLDLIRASQLPPLSRPLAQFLTPYVDGRDLRGPVVVSHIFLLIGCAIPVWLSLASIQRAGEGPLRGWEMESREVSMVAGVVCVGMGDAAASLIGRRYGRRKWPWAGGKSLEGSLAFALAVAVGLGCAKMLLALGQWSDTGTAPEQWPLGVGKAVVCGCGASLMEAVLTGGNDNVVVPVVLWLLVRGLRL